MSGEVEPVPLVDSEVLQSGKDAVLIAEGAMVKNALGAADLLAQKKISLEVISLRTIKPLDIKTLKKSIGNKKFVFTIEDHVASGGVGFYIHNNLSKELKGKTFTPFSYPDEFIEHGGIDEIQKLYKLDSKSIAASIEKIMKQKK